MIKIRVKNSGLVKLRSYKDEDGELYVAEAHKHVPIDIKRVYFINVSSGPNTLRGRHAHKKFKQIIFCVKGSFVLALDDGKNKQNIAMNKPDVGVILGPMLWHEMNTCSKDCSILVLADKKYDEKDYIRNYDDFLKYIKKHR